jgi:hypothetical protein
MGGQDYSIWSMDAEDGKTYGEQERPHFQRHFYILPVPYGKWEEWTTGMHFLIPMN